MTSTMEGVDKHSKKLCPLEDEFGNYDVFISHRGPDTKTGFVGYIYEALKRVGLHPFLDCISISKGQDAWKCIDHAIQMTPLALVVFSKSFAKSEWCLKELHAMLHSPSMKVLPIFYKVRPWEVNFPEKGQLAGGFMKLVDRHNKSLIEEWRSDLKRASKLNGWEYNVGDKRLEKDLVLEVVGKIFELANKPLPLDVGEHIVGVKQVAKNLIQVLDEKEVLMLGLWGMGGIGKSTLARELYNQLGQRFDGRCYVEDVVAKVNQGGVTTVQNLILKAFCEDKKITDKSRGKVILEERLSKKSFLLVLDDVCDDNEMDYLMSRKMLKEGSLCIVTSRNCRVFEKPTSFLVNHEVHTHDVQTLSKKDSQSVFACHVFGGHLTMKPRFQGLVRDISMACGGVPLVLKVCGSLLRDEEDVEIWEEVLKKLKCGTIMDEKKIFECLRISYDSLQKQHQEMFLDIACALLGESVEVAKCFWRSQGYSAALGVRSLVEKALIRVDGEGAFVMHDHLRDMGRALSKQERASVGVCKHLWGSESSELLTRNEPLPDSLKTLIIPWRRGFQIDLSLMKRLLILKFEGGLFPMSSLPENLCWLDYNKNIHAALRHFPEAPKSNDLVILYWTDDLMDRLPESFKNLRKLEVLNLGACYKLTELPNSFGELTNLVMLNLEFCRKLQNLPDSFSSLQNLKILYLKQSGIQSLPKSFGTLCNLEVLNLQKCGELVELPESFGGLQNLKHFHFQGSGIQSLPKSFGKLISLEVLNLQKCGELTELPESFGGLQNLKHLHFQGSGIQSLPKSFGKLTSLEVLNPDKCDGFKELPESFGGLQNLKRLDVKGSGIQSLPKSFGEMANLKLLNPKTCDKFVKLPDSFGGLQNLKILDLKGSGIQSLPKSFGMLTNLELLNLQACYRLVELPNSFGGLQNLKNLDLKGSGIQSLPKSFGKMTNLELLILGACYKLMKLPNSFGGLQNLKSLDLKRSGIQSLPKSFGKLTNLEVLNLEFCRMLQSLPDSFRGLQNLKILYLEQSGIQNLPISFGTLRNLEVLNLWDCSGLVELPDSFGGLQNLKNLDLKRSGIQSLFKSVGLLNNLEVLNLGACYRLAELPDSFGDLQNLNHLDFTSSGIRSLPKSFGKLINLEVLNLKFCCKLENLPDSFGGLHNLKCLYLQGSGIQSLPKSFGKLSNLEVLNLGACYKLVELPNSFGGLQNLNNLDFISSGIQSLPKSFGKLNNLKVLNLWSCGKLKNLPDSFGGLRNLKNLDLRRSGIQSLPKSFGKLSNLEVLDLESFLLLKTH